MVEVLNKQYYGELHEDCLPLLNAYSDVEQFSKKETEEGYVKVSFISKEEDSESYEDKTIQLLGD